jgi:hypothetical protein
MVTPLLRNPATEECMFGLVTLKKTNMSSKKIGSRSRRSNDGGVDAALGKKKRVAIQKEIDKRDA